MLQNGKVTAFIVRELLWENQQSGYNYPSPRLGLKEVKHFKEITYLKRVS